MKVTEEILLMGIIGNGQQINQLDLSNIQFTFISHFSGDRK